MASFVFNPDNQDFFNPKFFSLGINKSDLSNTELEKVQKKLSFNTTEKPDRVWATLGWVDDHPFNPEGRISFSSEGNHESESKVTRNEIGAIWDFNPLSGEAGFVKERYVNFDKVNFNLQNRLYKIDELPELRLTLFLGDDEGAVVYYQHSDVDKFLDSDADEEADIEYILPQPTTAEVGTTRDRLSYHFPIVPSDVEEDENNPGYVRILDSDRTTSFIVKILTFKRHKLKEENLLMEAISNLNIKSAGNELLARKFGLDKYQLLNYDSTTNTFPEIKANAIDFDKKTLLLIHGTFSSIEGSYGGTYHTKFAPNNQILNKLIEDGKFEQILGFNHPTITHDAKQNAEMLYQYLGNNRFKETVSLVGTSRGALVCKHLASDIKNTNFIVDRILTYSGANGVHYFEKAKHVKHFLKILKKTAGPAGKVLTAFAQFSVEFFLDQPGSQQMTPDNKRLTDILDAKPLSPTTRYQCVAADWDKSLQSGWRKRVPRIILDAAIKLILGKKNDWVVNFENQKIAPFHYSNQFIEIKAGHTKVLHLNHAIGNPNPHEIMYNFFK